MNIVNFGADVQKMTSREIAEITGKRHKHVLADIRKMLSELGLDANDFATKYKDSYGRMQPCFNLPKLETLTLVTGYSIPMLTKVLDRLDALETGKATPAAVPTNRASEDIAILSALADALRLEGSARLSVMHKGMEVVAPHLLPAVPAWRAHYFWI